jgi:quinol monooxygenase YgiN
MSETNPVTTLVSYYPKAGKEQELLALIEKHWPTLERLSLVSSQRAQIWRASDKRTNQSFFVELFQWKDETASDIAHQTPEVMAVWETMGPLLENLQLTRLEPLE